MNNQNDDNNSVMISGESFIYVGGKLISHWKDEPKPMEPVWTPEDELQGTPNIGISQFNQAYLETNDIQESKYEYRKIQRFLQKYIQHYAQKTGVSVDDLSIEFINYGKTELVYVLTQKNDARITLLVKQPAVQFGKVKQEAINLLALEKKDKKVVAPVDYFSYGEQELYATPYIDYARCVASYGRSWGMYIPEPTYRFEAFTSKQSDIVTACMIAKLVSYYDFDKQEGLCACKLGGGDFMLPQGWENEEPTIQNTLNNLYFIAAREKVSCSFENYLETIRQEFSRRTIDENQEKLVINLRGRVPMQLECIEAGIKLGKSIIHSQKLQANKKNPPPPPGEDNR